MADKTSVVLALRLVRTPKMRGPSGDHDLALPRGCVGIMYAFATEEDAREAMGGVDIAHFTARPIDG